MTSIRRWLLGWLIASLAAAAALAGVGIFHMARNEANELFDYELRTVALSLPADVKDGGNALRGSPDFRGLAEDRLFIEVWDEAGRSVYRSIEGIDLPRFAPGLRSIERNEYLWRVFGAQQGDRLIQVAQPESVRDDLALKLALRTLWPLAALIPVILAMVVLLVRRGLKPISEISEALETRSMDSLAPLDFHGRIPVELKTLVAALNDLLARLTVASEAQRTFVADAAHELRSPLAALKLQIQAAARDTAGADARQAFGPIEERLNRVIHLVSQVLALAREDVYESRKQSRFGLRKLCERVVADHAPLAEAKDIDLGIELPADAEGDTYEVYADPDGIGTLLTNLVDNAIRYTPRGGKVDVTLDRSPAGVAICVADSGPGIPIDERGRVFNRFYRVSGTREQGSGLGLAIASEIARRHHVTLELGSSAAGGLSARLSPLPVVSP